jgi:hypothetical protein
MDPTREQRACIKFCANLGNNATETLAIIRQAFWEERRTRKVQARQVKSKVKNMVMIFFDIKGIVHKEFLLAVTNSQFRIIL